MKTQWEKRVDVTVLIYQHILMEYPKQELSEIGFVEFEFDADQTKILEYACDHYQDIVQEVEPLLEKTWTWNRLNYFDRAIIVEAIAEYRVFNTPKNIIIDQALITARQYNIDEGYKYINAILDKVIQ